MSINRVPTQIEAQRSGFDLERRRDGMTETCRLRRDEDMKSVPTRGKQSLRPTLSVAGERPEAPGTNGLSPNPYSFWRYA